MDFSEPPARKPRVPFTTVLASIIGLWLCYFLLSTMRWELLGMGLQDAMLGRRAVSSLAGVAITIGLWLVLRLFDARPLWVKITVALVLSLPVAVSIAQANYLLFADMRDPLARQLVQPQTPRGGGDILLDIPDLQPVTPAMDEPVVQLMEEDGWISLIELSFSRYYLMLAWCALYLALLTGEKARAAERREGEFRRAAKAAELRSLRYQVNPHFLFNTLNSLSALVLTGKTKEAEQTIQTLSTFYRQSLADDPTSDVALASEFRLQRLYLDIESIRFPNRLHARYDLPADLAELLVPGMILQPLVENSVKHAVSISSEPVIITLAAREEYDRLVVTVSDNGRAGDAANRPRHDGHGIGLANVRERLEARYGREASMVSGPSPEGYATHLRMPIMTRQGPKE